MSNNWFDGLVKIFPQLRKVTSKIKLTLINIDNRNIDKRSVNVLNIGNLDSKQKEQLLKSLPKALSEGYEILESKYEEEAEDYSKKISKKKNIELIEYFQGKIPEKDLYALKASIYIKEVFDGGGDIQSLKQGLRNRYGQRGNNISNLYSAGYFETWIKPMYENSSSQDIQVFLETYELIVEDFPFAIFVSRDMSVAEITREIKNKINDCQKYGIETLNIHGIGEENIFNITKAVETLQKEVEFAFDFAKKGRLFVVKVSLLRTEKQS